MEVAPASNASSNGGQTIPQLLWARVPSYLKTVRNAGRLSLAAILGEWVRMCVGFLYAWRRQIDDRRRCRSAGIEVLRPSALAGRSGRPSWQERS